MNKQSSSILVSCFLFLVSSFTLSACSLFPQKKSTDLNIPTNQPTTLKISPTKSMDKKNDTLVGLTTKNGQMVIKLYTQETPNTAKNFLDKANSGFYDGLSFHRVISGFMAQGGDPTGTGMGGGKQKSELNSIPFKRGSLGLARTAETNQVSNDSQFFICFTNDGCAHLTGDYVNFGEVISGLDVLDKIAQGDKMITVSSTTK